MKIAPEKCSGTRRAFLKRSGLLGLGFAAAALFPKEKAEAVLFNRKEYKVSMTRPAMGTFVTITAIHSSRDEAENAIGLAYEEIDNLCALLSRYDSASPVSNLNTNGFLVDAPREMLGLVTRSLDYFRLTQGAFDITVKPLVDLFADRCNTGGSPSDSEVDFTLERIGSGHLQLENNSIRFLREGMGITLDGIAKGYIVDRVSAVLSGKGLVNHLINAGGDIRTSSVPAGGKQWTIAVEDPQKRKHYPAVFQMSSGAVATSGSYEVFFDHEKMFHHIVDGRTGHSPTLLSSATVKAATAMDADALSTSVFVMGPALGPAFINTLTGIECLVLDSNGSLNKSAGWIIRNSERV